MSKKPMTTALIAALTGLAPAALSAQVLEEIVVTADRRESTLQDVPIAVTALTSLELGRRNIRDFQSYMSTVPGATFYDTGGLTGNELKVRGVGNGTAQLSPTTAVYLGEVPVIHTGRNVNSSYNFRVLDMERIEVLRGPQGQLFGSNSLGGAVRNIPSKPDNTQFSAHGSVAGHKIKEGGRGYDADITLNLPLIEDRLAARLTAYHATDAGWYDNVFDGGPRLADTVQPPPFTAVIPLPGGTLPEQTFRFQGQPFASPVVPGPPGILAREPAAANYAAPSNRGRNVNETETDGVRLMLSWEAGERLRLDLMLAYEKLEQAGGAFASDARGVPSMFGPPGSFDTPVLPGNFPNTVLYLTEAKNYEHSNPEDAGRKDEIKLANLVVEYEFDFATLTSSTSWWERKETLAVDISLLSVLIGSAGNTVPFYNERVDNPETVIQEFRLSSRQDQPLRWLAGLFYQDIEQDFSLELEDRSGLDLLYWRQVVQNELFGLPAPPSRIAAAQNSTFNDETWAVFGELEYDLSETLTAAFSFRYFDLDQDFETLGAGFQFIGAGLSRGSNSDDEFTPKFSLSWQPQDDRMVYLSAAKGFRTGIINRALPPGNCGVELANAGWEDGVPPTGPDTTWNYEFGTKLEFQNRVRANAAIYRIDWEDIQTGVFMTSFNPVPSLSQCTADVVINAGSATITGAELEVSALLTDRLRLDFSANVVDGEYDDDVPQANISKGTTIENQPKFSSFLSLNYDFDLVGQASYAAVEWQYVGDIEPKAADFVTQAQTQDIGDYHLINLRFGVDVSERIGIDLFVENLTNEFGVTQTLDTGGLSPPVVAAVRPRTVGARLRWNL